MNPHEATKSICFLTNAYPDASSPFPSYGRFIRELVEHLTQNNIIVSVVTPRLFRSSKPREARIGEKVYRFWFWSEGKRLIEYRRIPVLRMLTYLASGVLTGLRVVRKDKCDLIHAHWVLPSGLIAVWVGRILNKPVVLTAHGSDAQRAFEKKGSLRILFGWSTKRANCVTTVSHNMATKIEASGIGKDKILVFPMGVSDSFFPSERDDPLAPRNNEITVIISNRLLLPLYNVECLIQAVPHVVSRCDKVLFLVANDGERRSVLESMARQMKLLPWVRFLGHIPHGDMSGLLNSSHIYVSTSPADGASVSLLEAMASGLFPVVTDIPANREWINDGENGFLVPPSDEMALAEKLCRAIEDDCLRNRAMRINVRIVRERASWERISQILREIYERVVSQSECYN